MPRTNFVPHFIRFGIASPVPSWRVTHGTLQMLNKKVYVNDQLIGEARTWSEVHALIRTQGLLFLNKPGAAEGPSGFYISGTLVGRSSTALGNQRTKTKPPN